MDWICFKLIVSRTQTRSHFAYACLLTSYVIRNQNLARQPRTLQLPQALHVAVHTAN